jgi:hypothetical protein
MQNQIINRDPADLRLHPLQKKLPEPDKQSPEWISFVEGWLAAGVETMPPLIITTDGLVMDGGRRWRAARQLQWTQVPCLVRPEAEAAALIVETLLGQRNLPRGTKVYLTLELMPEFVKASETRRLNNLKRGVKIGQNPLFLPKESDFPSGNERVTEFCARLGVSDGTYKRAVRVRDLFEKHPDFRAEFEPDLLSGEKSLWNVESAIKGAMADQSKREPSKERSQLELFGDAFDNLRSCARGWSRFSPENQQRVLDSWKTTVTAMPAELRRELADILESL